MLPFVGGADNQSLCSGARDYSVRWWDVAEGRWTDGLLMELLLDGDTGGEVAPDRAGDV